MIEENKKQYDKMTRLALDVLSDYGFFCFPLDVFSLAKKIGMKLIPYHIHFYRNGVRDKLGRLLSDDEYEKYKKYFGGRKR